MRPVRFVAMTRASGAVASTLVISTIMLGGQAPAWSKPTPTPSKTTAAAQAQNGSGQELCAITGPPAARLSGLVARPDGYVAVNDAELNQSNEKIFFFDSNCKLKATTVSYPTNALDPEDLALGTDNVLWVADIGDNTKAVGGSGNRRETIALWSLAPGVNVKPVIHRLKYPDGPHDAEALVLNGDNTPVIVTKEDDDMNSPKDTAGVYVASGPLQPNGTVDLTKAGEFKIPATDTSSILGPIGRKLVTGGANSPDRKRVALRTYSDAFEWDVPDGNAASAIVKGAPRITPLPGEKQGESLAYSADGKFFLTLSDLPAGPTPILQYTPSTTAPATAAASAGAAAPPVKKKWTDGITPSRLIYGVGGIGLFGLLLLIIGALGIRRSRETRRNPVMGAKVSGSAAMADGQEPAGSGALMVVGGESAWQPDWSDPEWSGVPQGNQMPMRPPHPPVAGPPMGAPPMGAPPMGAPSKPSPAMGAPHGGTVYGSGGFEQSPMPPAGMPPSMPPQMAPPMASQMPPPMASQMPPSVPQPAPPPPPAPAPAAGPRQQGTVYGGGGNGPQREPEVGDGDYDAAGDYGPVGDYGPAGGYLPADDGYGPADDGYRQPQGQSGSAWLTPKQPMPQPMPEPPQPMAGHGYPEDQGYPVGQGYSDAGGGPRGAQPGHGYPDEGFPADAGNEYPPESGGQAPGYHDGQGRVG